MLDANGSVYGFMVHSALPSPRYCLPIALLHGNRRRASGGKDSFESHIQRNKDSRKSPLHCLLHHVSLLYPTSQLCNRLERDNYTYRKVSRLESSPDSALDQIFCSEELLPP